MCVLRSCVAVIRLDFCAGDRPDVLGLGLEVGLLQTLDRSWGHSEEEKHLMSNDSSVSVTEHVDSVKLLLLIFIRYDALICTRLQRAQVGSHFLKQITTADRYQSHFADVNPEFCNFSEWGKWKPVIKKIATFNTLLSGRLQFYIIWQIWHFLYSAKVRKCKNLSVPLEEDTMTVKTQPFLLFYVIFPV